MFLLIMKAGPTAEEYGVEEVEVWKREFEVPDFSSMKGTADVIDKVKRQKMEGVADKVRQYMSLTTGHVSGIADWLMKAKVGDTLLTGSDVDDPTDEIAIVMCNGYEPKISRLLVEEVKVTKTKVSVVSLPGNVKAVTPKSKKKKRK